MLDVEIQEGNIDVWEQLIAEGGNSSIEGRNISIEGGNSSLLRAGIAHC
jgi:hypothetical protein